MKLNDTPLNVFFHFLAHLAIPCARCSLPLYGLRCSSAQPYNKRRQGIRTPEACLDSRRFCQLGAAEQASSSTMDVTFVDSKSTQHGHLTPSNGYSKKRWRWSIFLIHEKKPTNELFHFLNQITDEVVTKITMFRYNFKWLHSLHSTMDHSNMHILTHASWLGNSEINPPLMGV